MANEFITDEHTEVLQKLVQEIEVDTEKYIGQKFLPAVSVPARKIRVEILEATGGMTNEHMVGTPAKYIQKAGSRAFEFEPGAYKEAVHFDEREILYLRELGQNDRSKRGVRQYIDRAVKRLNQRMDVRMEWERWQVIFNGGSSFMGKSISFGIPSANRAVPVGAVWSSNGTSANNSADPVGDLRYWLNGGYATFRKYAVKGIIMNPNTERWILDNTNVQGLIKYGFGERLNRYDANDVLSFLIPGLPPITVYKGWYRSETVVDGKLTVGAVQYHIPDGYIFFETELPDGDGIGELVMGTHLASGSVDSPGFGKFLVVEDNIGSGTKGGPGNPFMDIFAGYYGSAKLDRPFDVLTAKVIA